jgi:hypothetical protein
LKGDEKMNKRSLILIIVLMVTLLFVMSSAVSAQPDDPGAIQCDLDIINDEWDSDGYYYWLGSVSGDECSVAGTIRFDAAVPDEGFFPGSTYHFVEEFTIWPANAEQEGAWIKGKDCGVWNFSTFNYRAQGWVTKASDEFTHLIGAQYHEKGTTIGDPFAPEPLYALGGQMKLVPGNRRVDPLPLNGLCPPRQEGEE